MEPRRDDGDDVTREAPASHSSTLPQWSPVVTTGTTYLYDQLAPAESAAPQWSPVVTTGTTRTR